MIVPGWVQDQISSEARKRRAEFKERYVSNEMKPKPYMILPPTALQFCTLYDAVVIGSGAEKLYKNLPWEKNDDLDIIVPIDQWTKACKLVPRNARANAFGGFKYTERDLSVDVWPDDVARVLFNSPWKEKNGYLWSPKYGGVLQWWD